MCVRVCVRMYISVFVSDHIQSLLTKWEGGARGTVSFCFFTPLSQFLQYFQTGYNISYFLTRFIHNFHPYTHTHTNTYKHTHARTHAQRNTNAHTHTHPYTHTYTHTCTHAPSGHTPADNGRQGWGGEARIDTTCRVDAEKCAECDSVGSCPSRLSKELLFLSIECRPHQPIWWQYVCGTQCICKLQNTNTCHHDMVCFKTPLHDGASSLEDDKDPKDSNLQVTLRKLSTNYRALSRKTAHKDKTCYGCLLPSRRTTSARYVGRWNLLLVSDTLRFTHRLLPYLHALVGILNRVACGW